VIQTDFFTKIVIVHPSLWYSEVVKRPLLSGVLMQAGALNVFKPHGVATELFPVVFYCEFRHVWRSIQPVAPNIFF